MRTPAIGPAPEVTRHMREMVTLTVGALVCFEHEDGTLRLFSGHDGATIQVEPRELIALGKALEG